MTHPLTRTARGVLGGATTRTGPPPVERPAPLREAVYDALVEMIITAELQPGQHLVENDLAAQLGVSRQPVREALQRMQTEGWVDLRPALGAFVHVPTEDEADQLLAARTLLETESARLAAEHATPEQLEHLWELHRSGEAALAADDQEGLVAANASLHSHIVSMSRNKVLGRSHRVGRPPGAVVLPTDCPRPRERCLGRARRTDRSDRRAATAAGPAT